MKRRSDTRSLKRWMAGAVVAAALLVGAAASVVTVQDDTLAAPKVREIPGFGGGVQPLGGSWS